MSLMNEVIEHFLGYVEIRNNAVAQRPDGHDVARCAADHLLGFGADSQDLLGLFFDRHDRRFIDDNAAIANIDQGVCCPQVDADIKGEKAEKPI